MNFDEAHFYKNRQIDSAIDGMSHLGSQRAQDLDSKLWALRRRHDERVATFATATPVANSMAELWTMQRYLQPDVLDSLDMGPFDAWAANFGRTVTAVELSPDGSSYRLQTRFARFQNVPELLTMYHRVADVRTNEDLDMALPSMVEDKARTVVVPASAGLVDYVEDLAQRAEQVRNRAVTPDEDNMLKITGDGRRAALDLRLVDLPPDDDGGKLAVAADRIAAIHHASRDLRYTDLHGAEAPRRGGLQLVFCDVSTPAPKGWNAYDELRGLLAQRGVPRDDIRFMHEASTDDAKSKLFAACRDGRVAVLVGSTEKMGVGTNVPARALALHLDCPWRPADIEQREGRLLRQGSQNPEVEILRYVLADALVATLICRRNHFRSQHRLAAPGSRRLGMGPNASTPVVAAAVAVALVERRVVLQEERLEPGKVVGVDEVDVGGDELRHPRKRQESRKCDTSIYSFNDASVHLHNTLGFQVEGRIRRAIFTGGHYHDEVLMGITSEEFFALHQG